ncbi:MAG TPA: response regulator, partial [Roseiflexaceae bacterium]|nr:response regulator [Roseiflexaceae bacterium]
MPGHSNIILIVDDNQNNRDLLSSRLQRQGYQTATAVNGLEALALLRAQPFDLLLLDIMMPEMNGYQVLTEIRADDALRHIPVVVISALSDVDSIVRCVELGAEDYLFKPFNPTLLKARVSASLEKKRLRDAEQTHLAAVQGANRAKTEFISFVAHELKTPMTAIVGYTDMLTEGYAGEINEAQREFLTIIRSNAALLKALISDLSDISRIETGHLQLWP